MSCEELAALKAKLAPQLVDMETVGRSRARFVAADLLMLLRHYKALALDATPLGDCGGSSLIAPVADTPHFSDCDTQTPRDVFVDHGSRTSFNKLRYDVGVQDDLFISRVALFNDAYELSGWFLSSIYPFNFNDEEIVPWMNVAVERMKAHPVVPLPSRWGSPSRNAAASSTRKRSASKPTPKPYIPPHNRSGAHSGGVKVVTKYIERHHHPTILGRLLANVDLGVVAMLHVLPALVVHQRVLRTFLLVRHPLLPPRSFFLNERSPATTRAGKCFSVAFIQQLRWCGRG
ncbi:hypothetical protein CYMTET_17159 [Cymbomonas tetramitiformis]|uniref:Uncharacterized protein n=1 Tax=Cymbomonas tetramitiformis TaxID=36881 RepID=A0AAE0L7E8_9CHLO|nr:hypothetical protein CYMTET_17159 [Cymbomonas tetramitiformis]